MSRYRFAARYLLISIAVATGAFSSTAVASEIDEQREIFKRVYADVERGNWKVVDDLPLEQQRLLSDYVLWPDLRATFFRATLGKTDHEEVESFLDQHGVLRPARDLRYRYALYLADAGDLAGYLAIYQRFYQGQEIAKLDCLALRAEIAAGRHRQVIKRATELWMVGKSQVEECDPVFDYLTRRQLLGPVDFARRFDLAIEAREFAHARWLAGSIDEAHVEIAEQWQSARSNPVAFVRNHRQLQSSESARQQLLYAIERITYSDPVEALEHWKKLKRRHRFAARDEILTSRHIALWSARDRLPGAYKLLTALSPAAQNDEVLRWRARSSLANRKWKNLLVDIELMSEEEKASEKWRYWQGIAMRRLGRHEEAPALLAELALERSYYGFLAADELGVTYALDKSEAEPDEVVIAELAQKPELIRARELFLVGLDSRGRSEWDATVGYFSPQQKIQAAKLAGRWGWHSRAISTAASAGDYDDLSLRYPLPYRQTFVRHAGTAGIPPTWAYGVARSESLFMRDVRSSAGAIGLMQLMPATGRDVAQQLNFPYSGLVTLTNPDHNIRLGTSYLGQMADRFGGNRVLATAAYNAGPHRVDRWLPDSGSIDARTWIENIPFNETRDYVRRVMTAETIFHWRMTGQTRRLSDSLGSIRAAPDGEKLARN